MWDLDLFWFGFEGHRQWVNTIILLIQRILFEPIPGFTYLYFVDSEDNSQKGLKIKTFQNKDGISETISSLAAAATH